jgi:hypothetical protein
MLAFAPVTITPQDRLPFECYLLSSAVPEAISDKPITDVIVGTEIRSLSTNVVSRIVEFAADADRRSELNHDCAAFARACTLGSDLDGIRLGNRPGYTVYADLTADITAISPDVAPGTVLLSSRATYRDPTVKSAANDAHLMVRASVEDCREVLYASKLGPANSVALHTLDQINNLYPRTTLAKAVVGLRRRYI